MIGAFMCVTSEGVVLLGEATSGKYVKGNITYTVDSAETGRETYKGTYISARRVNNHVEVWFGSTYLTAAMVDDGSVTLESELPSTMRPNSDIFEAVNYGEDKYSIEEPEFTKFTFVATGSAGSSTYTEGQMPVPRSYGHFLIEFEKALNYDLVVIPLHSNGEAITEKDSSGNYFQKSMWDVSTFTIPAGTKSFTTPFYARYGTAGKTYYLACSVTAVGYNYSYLKSMQITTVEA